MGLTGCCSIVKFFVILLNLIFWLLGLAMLVSAIFMLTDPTYVVAMTQDEHNYYIALYIFLAVGAVLVIVAFLGCCGAFKESQCMLVSFFCLLLIVLVAEIAAGSWAFYNKDKLDDMIFSHVRHTVKEEYGVVPTRTYTFDALQAHLGCCGAAGPSDWSGSKYNEKKNSFEGGIPSGVIAAISKEFKYNVPQSCCKAGTSKKDCEESRSIVVASIFSKHIYTDGCMQKVAEHFKNNIPLIMGIAIGVIVVQFFGLILSLFLCCAIDRNDNYKG